MQTYYNLTPLCSDTHFQLQHYRYLPRPADFEGAETGTIVGRRAPRSHACVLRIYPWYLP